MTPEDCISVVSGPYRLLKYPPSKKYDSKYREFRSIILKDDKVVCMSPSKSICFDTFMQRFPIEECCMEEFVEGIMINVFYDGEWRIATKSKLDALCTFDSSRTFAEMFEECKQEVGLTYDMLNPEYSYSFVIQHPDHRIVTKIETPHLICVAMFHLEKKIELLSDIFPPRRYVFDTYEEAKTNSQEGLGKGIVFKFQGYRSKLRNTKHDSIEQLKMNMPFQQRYLRLRKSNLYDVYLSYFPEDQVKGMDLECKISEVTMNLYELYRYHFIYKQKKNKSCSLMSYLHDLHTIYLHEFFPEPLPYERVVQFVNLYPKRVSYLLNAKLT